MNIRDEGIVLKEMRYKETSKILTILTKKHGKIHGMARGAYKPKSQLMVNTQPFSYNNYIFFKGRNFYYINQADTIDSFYSIRENINRIIYGSYLLELADISVLEEEDTEKLFLLLKKGLEVLSNLNENFLAFTIAYELKFISFLGYKPLFDRCAVCGTRDIRHFKFSIEYGGIICDRCSITESNSEYMDLDMYKCMKELLYTPLDRINIISISSKTMFKLHDIMVKYILHKIDRKKFNSLDTMKYMIREGGEPYGDNPGDD
ncbi:MAG TPA: DNA repair protein RecO [Tissierellia bacterium]|mgnify:CR=1 FL=1|nr:DNA repair protein RecO [Tissierellia bacterium]